MRKNRFRLALGGLSALLLALGIAALAASASEASSSADLRPVSTFGATEGPGERSAALFTEAGRVLQHARCVNCHPAGDRPLQGDAGDLHQPWVRRGSDGFGAVGMRCGTCHHEANFDPGRVPGAPHWHLAPIEMAWEGKSLAEICAQLKDPARNGGRDLAAIVQHMKEDPLVGWAWSPGVERAPVPGDQQTFGDLIEAWVESGAVCPADR